MTQIDSELVKQLAGILNDTGLTEIEYDTGGIRIRVARSATQVMVAPTTVAAPVATGGGAPAAGAAPVSSPR